LEAAGGHIPPLLRRNPAETQEGVRNSVYRLEQQGELLRAA